MRKAEHEISPHAHAHAQTGWPAIMGEIVIFGEFWIVKHGMIRYRGDRFDS
jgi:hypothetical protein